MLPLSACGTNVKNFAEKYTYPFDKEAAKRIYPEIATDIDTFADNINYYVGNATVARKNDKLSTAYDKIIESSSSIRSFFSNKSDNK